MTQEHDDYADDDRPPPKMHWGMGALIPLTLLAMAGVIIFAPLLRNILRKLLA